MLPVDLTTDDSVRYEYCDKNQCKLIKDKINLPIITKQLLELKGRIPELGTISTFLGQTSQKPAPSCGYIRMINNLEKNG